MRSCYALIITCIILSCAGSSFAQGGKISKEDYLKAKETDNEVFVVTSDSVKHSGTKLKFPPRYFRTSEYIAIDGVQYPRKKIYDIIAYQTEDMYHAFAPCVGDDVTRIRKGKIDLYVYNYAEHMGTDVVMSRHYIIKIDNQFRNVYYELLDKRFADNPAVQEKFHELFPDEKKADKVFLKNRTNSKVEAKTLKDMLLLIDMYNGN